MDRANTAAIERAEILALWPEFACLTHRLAFATKAQNALLLARLARNAMRLSTGCIVWTAACNNDGYGRITLWDRTFKRREVAYVHRIVLLMKTGRAIPHFREVAHSCDVPPCFHPAHLSVRRIPDNRRASAENTHRKRARAAALKRAVMVAPGSSRLGSE